MEAIQQPKHVLCSQAYHDASTPSEERFLGRPQMEIKLTTILEALRGEPRKQEPETAGSFWVTWASVRPYLVYFVPTADQRLLNLEPSTAEH